MGEWTDDRTGGQADLWATSSPPSFSSALPSVSPEGRQVAFWQHLWASGTDLGAILEASWSIMGGIGCVGGVMGVLWRGFWTSWRILCAKRFFLIFFDFFFKEISFAEYSGPMKHMKKPSKSVKVKGYDGTNFILRFTWKGLWEDEDNGKESEKTLDFKIYFN